MVEGKESSKKEKEAKQKILDALSKATMQEKLPG
jgi:hypothetical protein